MPVARGEVGRLRLNIVGKFSASVDGQQLILSRKDQALLGYMILTSTRQIQRAKVLGLLWSEKGDRLAQGSLRHALSKLRKQLNAAGCDQFKSDPPIVTLDIDTVACDAIEIVTDAERGVVNPLLFTRERLTDEILADVESVDPAYSEWLTEARPVFHQRLIDALTRLLPGEDETAVSETQQAAAKAIHLLDCDNERAVRALIKAHAAAGNIGAALAVYARLWRQLDDAYEIEPHTLTQDLIARIRTEQPEIGAAPLSAAASVQRIANLLSGNDARPSIAVLPFRPGSPDIESYFTSGIVDNVIHVLASFKELFVISRSSTLSFRDAAPDLRAIGQTLGVRYILHGTVQRAGNRLRIQTELVDAEHGEVVRTHQHNGAAADLFELQDQLAIDVVKAIAPYIRERELKRALRKRPQDMTAYDYLLQALEPMFQLDYASYVRARTLLQRAMDIDPTYAPAFAYAAVWHAYRIGQEWSSDTATDMRSALTLAKSAIDLDSTDALAVAVYGYLNGYIRKDFATARAKLDEAMSMCPNLPLAWTYSAALGNQVGDTSTAIKHAEYALRLTPMDAHIAFYEAVVAQSHYMSGNFEEAVAWGLRSQGHNGRLVFTLRTLISALVEIGKIDAAREHARAYLQLVPATSLKAWMSRTPVRSATASRMVECMRLAGLPD